MAKIGQNEPCPCGSGKKYKKCCGLIIFSPKHDTLIEDVNPQSSPNRFHYLQMRRSPTAHMIPFSQIRLTPNFEPDARFLQLFDDVRTGKERIAFTRVTRTRIQSGFTRIDSNGIPQRVESHPIDQGIVEEFVHKIREGRRPPIWLYHGNETDLADFVCSDDLYTLRAYEQLGIKKVLAIVMAPNVSEFEETALIFRKLPLPQTKFMPVDYQGLSLDVSLNELIYEEYRVPVGPPDEFPSILGMINDPVNNFLDYLDKIRVTAEVCLLQLRRFHLRGENQLHYHHTLASALVRTSRLLSGMKELIAHGFPEQALMLLRSLYELAVSVYLDWLAPELIGWYFQLNAAMGKQGRSIFHRGKSERLKSGWPEAMAEAARKSEAKLYDLVLHVKERAKISPLRAFHDELYRAMSQPTHQDFLEASLYAHALEEHTEPAQLRSEAYEGDITVIVQYADLSAALICYCVDNDIGSKEGGLHYPGSNGFF
jgi:hypothetical protein